MKTKNWRCKIKSSIKNIKLLLSINIKFNKTNENSWKTNIKFSTVLNQKEGMW